MAQSTATGCDLAKLAKIKTRKANALTKMGKFAESVEAYESALQDNQDEMIKKGLQEAIERKEKADDEER